MYSQTLMHFSVGTECAKVAQSGAFTKKFLALNFYFYVPRTLQRRTIRMLIRRNLFYIKII